MANNSQTIFQRLNDFLINKNGGVSKEYVKATPYAPSVSDDVLFSTNSKDEYEKKLLQMRQQKLLSYQWIKAGADTAMETLPANNVTKLMYRDADLMDGTPEIATGLDIIGQEACPLNSKGKMLNIYSKSGRVKAVLEDLFVNRLNIHTELPPIARKMAKYGNVFRLLNINEKNGIMGWRELPVYEITRVENGYSNGYYGGGINSNPNDMKPDEVRFIWEGHESVEPYRNWQVAHFRLLNDTFFLPYGTSMLHKARRAWRMWSMMEDAMLIYRLDKSIERRVFKIYVGSIDDEDVQAYVQDVANNFKRTPMIDPATGQIDLRKNFLDVSTDYFIPVRSENAPNPIETLQGATWQNQMEDIEYMQNKILTALQIPKTYLNFQEPQGKGENLAIKDVRFARMINRVQQFLLSELNQIAMLHLFLLGMTDELNNFTLSLNNPTNQVEDIELDTITKRTGLATQLLADPGIGMPIFSLHKVLKDIMKLSDKEIREMMNEIRLEKAMAAELQGTSNIIKRTGMFDQIDRIYGDYNAMNNPQQAQQGQDQGGQEMGGGAPAGGISMAEAENGGSEGMEAGEEASMGMEGAPEADEGQPVESRKANGSLLTEKKISKAKSFTEKYFDMLFENERIEEQENEEPVDYDSLNTTIEYKINNLLDKVDEILSKEDNEEPEVLNESNAIQKESIDLGLDEK